MKEIVKKEEVLDMVSIDNIKTLEQADEILAMCNASDDDVLETYVQNAITRGGVYHKLTLVPNNKGTGGLGLLNEEVGERYNITKATVGNYTNIFNNKDIFLSSDLGSVKHDLLELNPTLRSLLDTIKKDPDNVAKMIEYRINSRGINQQIADIVTIFMDEVSEDIRYLFSSKSRVALGRLSTTINEYNKAKETNDVKGMEKILAKIVHIIKLDGTSELSADMEYTKQECSRLLKEKSIEITELKSENDMLKRRNKFLVDSFKLSDVKRFLNRANTNASKLKRYKPELEEAFNLLGIDTMIDEKKLKKVYKEKVSVHHSDITGDDEMFRKIIEANKLVLEYIKGL